MMSTDALMQLGFGQAEDLVDEGIHFANLPPNYVAWLLIPLGILLFVWLVYRRERITSPWARGTLITLRALAVLMVVLLLYDPYRQFRKVEEIRSLVCVLVDESASMAHHDAYRQSSDVGDPLAEAAGLPSASELAAFSRRDLVLKTLGPGGSSLIDKLGEKHDVKLFGFSSGKPRPITRLDDARSDGPRTATGDALSRLLQDPDIQARPDASIILVSDGRTNSGSNPEDVARFAGKRDEVPIHVIGVGDPQAMRDIALRFVKADEVILQGNTMKMELTLFNEGYEGEYVTIQVKDQQGRPWAAARSEKLGPSGQEQIVTIDAKATRPPGTYTLEVTVIGPAAEENKRNNSRKHVVTIKNDRLRVLYVDTLPRWEYRRLKNFLIRGEESFDTQCVLLSAEESFIQEHTVRPDGKIRALRGFPTDFEALDQYDVIIFGDVDPSRLAPTRDGVRKILANIAKFVDQGGGLAIICGDGWTPLSYVDTPLEDLLPVDISSGAEGGPLRNYVSEWKPHLTAVGRAHPILQIRKNPEENRRVWEKADYGLKALRWWYPVARAKPGAQVLAYHPEHRNRFGYDPIFVVSNYGDGPVFFNATDETWRWFYLRGPVDFNRFWGNVVRYLARAHLYRGSKRFKLAADASEYRQGESVQLTAWIKNRILEPETAPTWKVMIVPPDGQGRVVEFARRRDGEYSHAFKPSKEGQYQAWVLGEEGIAGPRYAPVTFEVRIVDPETDATAMDEAALMRISAASGGTYVPLWRGSDILERLRADTTRRSSVVTRPLKSRGWLPLVFLVLLSLEWILRKRWNLT